LCRNSDKSLSPLSAYSSHQTNATEFCTASISEVHPPPGDTYYRSLEQQNNTGITLHDQESKVELKNAFIHHAAILEENYLHHRKILSVSKTSVAMDKKIYKGIMNLTGKISINVDRQLVLVDG
jgi:hypothetical protein